MGKHTGIAWCDHTFNLWWGCEKISPGCDHCYAAAFDKRVGGHHWKPGGPRRFFKDDHLEEPLRWDRAAARDGVVRSVFCGSMMDLMEAHPDPEIAARQEALRAQLWKLIDETRHLDWLLLTKRPENFATFLPWARPGAASAPPANVVLMTTAENQEQAARRGLILATTPANRRGFSCEPLLEHVELGLFGVLPGDAVGGAYVWMHQRIHWVIAGCESGHKMRPCHVDWLRALRDECAASGVPFFLKQATEVDGPRGTISPIRVRPPFANLESPTTAKLKAGGVIELPYLDGVQHAAKPARRAA